MPNLSPIAKSTSGLSAGLCRRRGSGFGLRHSPIAAGDQVGRMSRIAVARVRADIKDMYVDAGGREMVPFLEVLDGMVKRGIEVRLIHAKDPGPNWRNDFDRYPTLWTAMERMLCPRVHFKCIIIDGRKGYFGSANLTGAGMGAKDTPALKASGCPKERSD